MLSLKEYSKRIKEIEETGKFPELSVEQKILWVYNWVSAFSNAINRDDKKDTEKRFAAIFVNLLTIANDLSINPDEALETRVKEIEECHWVCKIK